MIIIEAESLSGSVHRLVGGVKGLESYYWTSLEQAKKHLKENEWKILRVLSDKVVSKRFYDGRPPIITDLRLKRLLLLAKYGGNHKRWYGYYYYLGKYCSWIIGSAHLKPAGEAKLQELIKKP